MHGSLVVPLFVRPVALVCFAALGWGTGVTDQRADTPATALALGRPMGSYLAGFRTSALRDQKRVIPDLEAPARIQVGLWYPARGAGTAMTYADYVDLEAWDDAAAAQSPQEAAVHRRQWREQKAALGVDAGHLDRLLGALPRATRDAPAAAGRFPLIALAQGYGGALSEQFVLAEYLSSHGYVVVSMPHPAAVRAGTAGTAEQQVQLLPALIASARRESFVDDERLGLVAYSHCGACILLYQDRHRDAHVLLSLDGWEGYASGAAYTSQHLSSPPEEIGAPYAYLASDPRLVQEYASNPGDWDHSVVARLAGSPRSLLVYFRDLRHIDFTAHALLEFEAPGFSYSDGWQEGSRLESPRRIEAVHELARRFLDTHLRQIEAAPDLCDPASFGLVAGEAVYGASGACGVRRPHDAAVFDPSPSGSGPRPQTQDMAEQREPPTAAVSDDSHAAWSPDGRWIAFDSDRAGSRDLYVVRPDGSGLQRLTDAGGSDAHPAWSPDSLRLSFESDRGGSYDVWTVAVDGTDLQQVTRLPHNAAVSSWSADGDWIAFTGDVDGDNDVFIVRPDGSDLTRVTGAPEYDGVPRWSPDGARLAFDTSRSGRREIWTLEAPIGTQGEARALIVRERPAMVAAWSHDGRSLAYSMSSDATSGDLFIRDLETGEDRLVSAEDGWEGAASWSPDGVRLVFQHNVDGTWTLRVADLRTGRITPLLR